jgi:hypothetical protein
MAAVDATIENMAVEITPPSIEPEIFEALRPTYETVAEHLQPAERTILNLLLTNDMSDEDMLNLAPFYSRSLEGYLIITGKPIHGYNNNTNFQPPITNNNKRPLLDSPPNTNPLKRQNSEHTPRLSATPLNTHSTTPSIQLTNRFSTLQETNITGNLDTPKPKIKPITFKKTDTFKQILKNLAEIHGVGFHVNNSSEFVRVFPNDEFSHRKISTYLKEH